MDRKSPLITVTGKIALDYACHLAVLSSQNVKKGEKQNKIGKGLNQIMFELTEVWLILAVPRYCRKLFLSANFKLYFARQRRGN